jgi:hypothetical protein
VVGGIVNLSVWFALHVLFAPTPKPSVRQPLHCLMGPASMALRWFGNSCPIVVAKAHRGLCKKLALRTVFLGGLAAQIF